MVQWLVNKLPLGSHQNTCSSKIGKWIIKTEMSSIIQQIILCKYGNVKIKYLLTSSIHGVASVRVVFFVVNEIN